VIEASPTSAPAICLDRVCKRYPLFELRDLSLKLERGQIMGLVGPNGAGKSTTLRLIMGLARADSGAVHVLGHPMPEGQVEAKRSIGYVSDEMRLYAGKSVDWHLRFMRQMLPQWDQAEAQRLLREFGVAGAKIAGTLSTGERSKTLLALALARRPQLLVLDEPTNGLDPVSRHEVLGALMSLQDDGEHAIVFSSHNTRDVEQICDQIAFIDRGRLVAADERDVFLDRWQRLTVELPEGVKLPPIDAVVEAKQQGRTAVLTACGWSEASLQQLQSQGGSVLRVQSMTLEEIFVASVLADRARRTA
jgi:ABC-2 type transport system ATP-binding protein